MNLILLIIDILPLWLMIILTSIERGKGKK
jgi:hypothetical protein